MQVPERLALIGGSILLSSALIFTLKSQASHILPKVEHPIDSIYDHTSDVQNGNNFSDDLKNAQSKGWKTGQWGTAKFYVDDQGNMHIGSGKLNGRYTNVVDVSKIHTIALDDRVQAPRDSSWLFASNGKLQYINSLSNLDTSNTYDMEGMFDDNRIESLDLSDFNTSHVNKMTYMFTNDGSLTSLDLSHFDTSNVNDMGAMFDHNFSIRQLSLGSDTHLNIYSDVTSGKYRNGNQTLNDTQLRNGSPHPGTWIKQ